MADHVLTCVTCSAQFNHHRRKAYCSTRCRPSRELKGTDQHVNAACRQEHTCFMCDKVFKPKRAGRTKFCGRLCSFTFKAIAKALRKQLCVSVKVKRNKPESLLAQKPIYISIAPQQMRCKECSSCYKPPFRPGRPSVFCSKICANADRRRNRKIAKVRRQSRKRGCGVVENIDPIKVFERDAWRCGICGVKTHRAKRGTHHSRAPELDHIVAIANGGSHTWANVQCSCRECNGRKGATDYGQIPLFAMA